MRQLRYGLGAEGVSRAHAPHCTHCIRGNRAGRHSSAAPAARRPLRTNRPAGQVAWKERHPWGSARCPRRQQQFPMERAMQAAAPMQQAPLRFRQQQEQHQQQRLLVA